MTWPTKKLGEIARIFSGSSAPQDEKYFKNGKYPFVRVFDLSTPRSGVELVETRDSVNDIAITELHLVEAKKGAIVFPKSGASILNNNRAMLGTNAYVVSHLSAIEVDENLAVRNWVYYFLSKFDMGKLVSDPGYPSLNISTIEKIKIPVPPIAIQKQIVERLDKIAEAQKLNDELIQKTDELFQSLLHKELNPAGPADAKAMAGKKDWEVKKLGDKNVLEIIDGDRGKNYPPKNEFQKSGYCLFLNTKNVTQAGFIFNEIDFISKERDEKLRKGKLQRNDVVLTTRGTVGNSALYDDLVEFNHIRINSGMVVLRPNIKEVIPKFLSVVISSKPVLRQFKQILSGTAQQQLPITNLVKIKFPLPPIKIQKQIVSKLSAVQDYKKQLLEQKSKLKELFDSALAKSMKN